MATNDEPNTSEEDKTNVLNYIQVFKISCSSCVMSISDKGKRGLSWAIIPVSETIRMKIEITENFILFHFNFYILFCKSKTRVGNKYLYLYFNTLKIWYLYLYLEFQKSAYLYLYTSI